jgi:transcriptional regulator with XRE-family HTH domain
MLIAARNSVPSGCIYRDASTVFPMDKTRRKPLEDWQKQDAVRLKALFEAAGPETQEKFGARFGIGSQALVWQYLNGYIPLNLRAAVRFARGLSCDVAEFSPTLAEDLPPTQRRPADLFEDIVESMPINEAQQVLDFIQYKFERSEHLMAEDKAASYSRWIARITEDLKRRREADGSDGK